LLANPTSTAQVDVERRARVAARNEAFNHVLADVCAATPRCLWDGGAAFNTVFEASDVSGDYFHPSVAGQAKLAAVSWANGYTWTAAPPPNQPPSASFTAACAGLTCDFANTSTDVDGTMTHAWDFDDGAISAETSPSHTYGAGGTFTVTLTVTDDDLARATTSQSVTVTSPTMSIQSLAATASNLNDKHWRATVTITVRDGTGAVLPNAVVSGDWTVGTSDTCTTGPAGSCTVTSDNLNRRNAPSVTFMVTGVTRAGYTYIPAANAVTSIVVPRP
jgi:PKD repeat protein